MTPQPTQRTREGASGTSSRRVDTCEGCGERHQTEFSLNLNARLCDGCFWMATEKANRRQ